MNRHFVVPVSASLFAVLALLWVPRNAAAQVTISPSTLKFPTYPVGYTTPITTTPPSDHETSVALTVTLTNNETTLLTVNSITATGDFIATSNCLPSVAAGASCTVNVQFGPTTTGTRTGTLTFNDSDPSSPQTVSLTGKGSTVGAPLPNLPANLINLFNNGMAVFNIKWDDHLGLGPVFTEAGCFSCHGGGISAPLGAAGNTSTILGTRYGHLNSDGSFDYLDGTGTFPNEGGPILHFQSVSEFAPLVKALRHCTLPAEVVAPDANVVNLLRSPQTFGFGFIDSIDDSTILANQQCSACAALGIQGTPNMVADQNGNTHVGRFGQKAGTPNLLFFSLQAEFNEFGITNQYFPNKHLPQGQPVPSTCVDDGNTPNDVGGANAVAFYQFMALQAPLAPKALSSNAQAGKTVFETIGCNLCHVETMQTDPNATIFTDLNGDNLGPVAALDNQTVTLYSDLLLHDMGPGLSGGIPLGQASLTQWRTAPLWGLSSRLQFGLLHDMRTTSIPTAIQDHGGEATQVINNYLGLSSTSLANLLAFLQSL